MKAKKKAWIVIIVLAVIGFCVGFYFGYNGEKDKQEQTNTQTRTQEKEIRAQGEMKDGELVDYTKNNMLELGKYKGRTVTVTPTETEVYQAILLEAEDWKKKVADGERVEKGDWISLDYEGYVDDQPSDDLSESGAVIQVGARNLFNAAFERGLMGLKLGETYNLNVTFAEDDADPDVAGKTITFSVEVNAKFNDAYAKKMSKNKYPNVKAYYEYAKAKEEKENREGIGDTVWEDLLKECNVKKYPAGSRKQAYKDQKRSYQVFAKVSGQSYEEFIGALQKIKDNTDAIPLYTNYAAGWTMGAWDAYIGGCATGDPDFMNYGMVHGENPFADNGNETGPFAVYNILYQAVSQELVEDDPTTTDWEGCKGMINNGEIGCMVLGSWAVVQMQEAGDNADDIGYMPFPITVDGKQYASAGPDYCYGINVHSDYDNQLASMIYVKWLTEESNFSYDQGGIPICVGNEYPDVLAAFDGVELVVDNPAPEGEEDLFGEINTESEISLNADNTHVQDVLEHALNGDKTMEEIADEWNQAWTDAQEEYDITPAPYVYGSGVAAE